MEFYFPLDWSLVELTQYSVIISGASQVALVVRNLPVSAGDTGDTGSIDPWVRKIPKRKRWQPIPICLPGEFHAQSSLAG